jgi:uncharacterized cofD-like protein
VHLVATLANGRRVRGETRITASRVPIKKLELSPKHVRPLPLAIEAIRKADLILLGPGSLYTSVLPNILIPEVASAIAHSKAPRVYIANLMTQPGETAGYALADHLRAIEIHGLRNLIDYVVANRQPVSPKVARRYRAQGAEPVVVDLPELYRLGCRVVLDNLLALAAAEFLLLNPQAPGEQTFNAPQLGMARHFANHLLEKSWLLFR